MSAGRVTLAVAVAVYLLAPSAARAEGTGFEKATAQVLFEEGRSLMAQGNVSAACARFEQSQKLDPAPGTLLNLAVCHEQEGRLATAWLEFQDAVSAAVRDGRSDREALARARIAALEGRLPRLVIRGQACAACELRLDGKRIEGAVRELGIPVDPGEHRLVVIAPTGRESAPRTAHVREGETVALEIPEAAAESYPVPTPAGAPSATTTSSPSRTLGFVSLGVAVGAVGVGAFFGLRALSLGSDANAACPTNACTSASAVDASRRADTSAWIANVALGTAVVAGGVGAILLLTSRAPSRAAQDALAGRVRF